MGAGRRPEFQGELPQFYWTGDVKAWLRNLELVFDAKRLTLKARFLHTIHLLAKPALNIYECSHHTSYTQLCEMLVRRFPTQHDRFYKFFQLVALRHGPGRLEEYILTFLELQPQIPDMSAFDMLDIFFGGLEPTVRIHLLDTQNAWTLELALEESRNFAKNQEAHNLFDDPMDLTVPTSLARQFP